MKDRTIPSLRRDLLAKKFSAVEITRMALAFAERENPATNAYLRLCPERALEAASQVDRRVAAGEDPGALAGVPVAVKDVIVTKDVRPPADRNCWRITSRLTALRRGTDRGGRGIILGKPMRRIRDGLFE